jgi:DNA mismatch repair ATPase MutS
LGIFEALASLAMISQLNPEWCFPEFKKGHLILSADDMGHPLINSQQRVNNDLKLDNQIAVITGSNMSGKTTLLRTIGVNLVLAYAGAPVCARKFDCTIMDVFTSMRISDDLHSGISTFYAELLRIKMIIDFSKNEQDMIFLVDEVFRGTNSRDRVTGARNVLLNLNKPWAIGLISTHDYELCDLENDNSGRITNYYFIESYTEDQIKFDYLLKPGSCKTSNAKYLMKMAGIEILE